MSSRRKLDNLDHLGDQTKSASYFSGLKYHQYP